MLHSVRAFAVQVKHPFVKQMFASGLTTNSCSWHDTNSRSGNTCSISRQKVRSLVGKGSAMAVAVVIPGRWADARRSTHASSVQMYARRRLMALFVLAAIVLVLLVSTGHVVANRGGAPASTPAVRLANASSGSPTS